MQRLAWPIFLVLITACTPLSQQQRPARGTLDCARRVLDTYVPDSASDDLKHCLAAGFIARHCSVGESYLLGLSKEASDAVGPGDAAWRDWQADRRGVACARRATADSDVSACCKEIVSAPSG